MAFGLLPKHIRDFKLEGIKEEHFLVLAIEAAKALDWQINHVSKSGFVAYTKFSMSSWSEEVIVKFKEGNVQIKSQCTGSQLVDWGKNKRNVDQLISLYNKNKESISENEINSKLNALHQEFDITAQNDDVAFLEQKDKLGFFSLFVPSKGYQVTPILVGINILLFVLMAISGVHIITPEIQSLLDWGANFRPVTTEGDWWRLLSACFIHIGIFHLLFNMYALIYIGVLLEPILGRSRFIAAYIFSGIIASVVSIWWNGFTVSAGASGAIFGMYGVFIALLSTNVMGKSVRKALVYSIVFFVGYNLLNGFKPNSGIDNAAHIGGLISGVVIGFAFIPSIKKNHISRIKYGTIGGLLALTLVFSFAISSSLSSDIGKYQDKINEFVAMESMALEVFNMPEGTSNEEFLHELNTRGLYYWKENVKLVESFKDLDLPEPIRERNSKLLEYCKLRIKSYELIRSAVEKDSDQYDGQISECQQKIELIIKDLTGQ